MTTLTCSQCPDWSMPVDDEQDRDDMYQLHMMVAHEKGMTIVDVPHISVKERALRLIETKERHVRTPAGVRKYGQPIGSVITRDTIAAMARRISKTTGVLKKTHSAHGWDTWEDGGHRYVVGKDTGPKPWVAAIDDDSDSDEIKVVAEGRTKAEVERLLNAHHSKVAKPAAPAPRKATERRTPAKKTAAKKTAPSKPATYDKTPYPRRTTDPKYNKKPGLTRDGVDLMKRDNFREVQSEQELAEHMKKYKYSIPVNAKSVHINPNPEDGKSKLYAWYVQVGGDRDGKPQPRWIPKARAAQDDIKWDRVREFATKVHAVEDQLTPANVNKDDTLAIIALMRRKGARVGSGDKRSAQNRGISELQRGDVKFSADKKTAYINYQGKKESPQTYTTSDPLLVGLLKARLPKMAAAPTTPFFPNTNYTKSNKLLQQTTGMKDVGNHDLRRLYATEVAQSLVKTWPTAKVPKDAKSLKAAIREVCHQIDVMLNDQPGQAQTSYVDPATFSVWAKKVGVKI